MEGRLMIHGELYLTLETIAECYRVDHYWLQEVYDLGLLGRGERSGGAIAITARQLDRVAEILQLHFYHGVNLPGIVVILGDEGTA